MDVTGPESGTKSRSKLMVSYSRSLSIIILLSLFLLLYITSFKSSNLSNVEMSSKSVALILGAGPRVGSAVAQKLAGSGYAVAVASRKGSNSRNSDGIHSIKLDLSQPASVKTAFDAVKAEFGAAPSLVVYNAATLTPPPVQGQIFSLSPENLAADLNINTVSPFAAAKLAVEGWTTLPKEAAKVFIFTGNMQNVKVMPMPMTVTLGVGKSGSSYWLGMADNTLSDQGYR